MKIEELLVSAIVFWAVFYLGKRFFKKKEDNSCKCDGENCDHKGSKSS